MLEFGSSVHTMCRQSRCLGEQQRRMKAEDAAAELRHQREALAVQLKQLEAEAQAARDSNNGDQVSRPGLGLVEREWSSVSQPPVIAH